MSKQRRFWALISLIVAGELIFSLPFHVPRYFRPSVLEAFSLTNTALGDIFAVYGITAILAYFPGGILADRFDPKCLIIMSLILTALGGIYFSSIPDTFNLGILYGYWGFTTIFLFWAGLMRATRAWGGDTSQGKAFGFLDGGRGLIAAIFASVGVWLFSSALPPTDLIEVAERKSALTIVILSYSLATAMAALLVLICLPSQSRGNVPDSMPKNTLLTVLSRPVVWLKALIIFCAYCGYKGLDNYGLYVHEVLRLSEIESAKFMAYMAFLRPVAAVLAGFLADRFLASSVIKWSFLLSSGGYIGNVIMNGQIALANIIFVTLMITFLTVFALRGVYFALLAETQTPTRLTGTTVGIISVIGYSPDIFFSPLAGRILDAFPGAQGYTYYFSLLTLLSLTGLLTTIILIKKISKGRV